MVLIFILKYHATNLDVEKIIWMYYCVNNFLGRMENDYIIFFILKNPEQDRVTYTWTKKL